jgi:hypothetical protein
MTRCPRRIRQTAVYRPFSPRTGRSSFLTIKGNELFREQIQEQAGSPMARLPAGGRQTRQQVVTTALRAALATYLIPFSWCTRPWVRSLRTLGARYVRPSSRRNGVC